MRILIVKTTSMGDVVHALPAVSDIAAMVPDARIDWLVERPFDAIVALHPSVYRVLPLAWRRWRKRLYHPDTWRQMRELRHMMRSQRYDLVIDMQGLLKSALWGAQAIGPRAGYDWASAWEPLATLSYRHRAAVSPALHAIERCRRLAAHHLGYDLPRSPPRFGLRPPAAVWRPADADYAVLNPNASTDTKLWPQEHWITLGRWLRDQGLGVVVMWGSHAEEQRAHAIVSGVLGEAEFERTLPAPELQPVEAQSTLPFDEALVLAPPAPPPLVAVAPPPLPTVERPPFLSVADAAGVLGRARVVVGLDTGFSHLAAALGVPTIGIYRDHDPAQVGITGDGYHASLGGIGQTPTAEAVIAAVVPGLDAPWHRL